MKRYVTQAEKDKRKAKVMKTPLLKASNHIPFNEYPIVSYKQKNTMWRKIKCTVTNEDIPKWSKAWCQQSDYLIRDEIQSAYMWMSDKGYMILKLKGEV